MGTDHCKFGFSRACVDPANMKTVAVRPQIFECVNCRDVTKIDDAGEVEVRADEDVEVVGGPSEGERKVKKVIDPVLPSSAEVLEHQLSRLPFRSWCPLC